MTRGCFWMKASVASSSAAGLASALVTTRRAIPLGCSRSAFSRCSVSTICCEYCFAISGAATIACGQAGRHTLRRQGLGRGRPIPGVVRSRSRCWRRAGGGAAEAVCRHLPGLLGEFVLADALAAPSTVGPHDA